MISNVGEEKSKLKGSEREKKKNWFFERKGSCEMNFDLYVQPLLREESEFLRLEVPPTRSLLASDALASSSSLADSCCCF